MPDLAPRLRRPVEARAGKFGGPSLIPALHAIQERVGWLPREELVALSREVHRPLYEIEGLISFYPHFRTTPPERIELRVCHDLSCWLRGADDRIAEARQRYGRDPDIEFTECSCLGRCDTGPSVTVNQTPATLAGADTLIAAARNGSVPDVVAVPSARRWPNDPYASAAEHYGVLRDVLSGALPPGQVTAVLADSGLRGMGGAGFPTGRKWELVAAQVATPKYAICNADESEPGTFKDRQILADQPHLVLEGMLLGMLATGAEEGWVFIRHEYGPEEALVRREIDRLRSAGLIGAGNRAGRARHRPAPVGGGVHLAGRLHPRRGVGADRVHGGAPRGTAEQAAVPRRVRPARPAHADELGRDVRARPGHRPAGRRLVERAGRGRERRAEVLRGLRPRRAPRGLLRADGHDRPAAPRGGRRGLRRRAARRHPAGRGLVELPRARASSTCRWTSARCGRPARCSGRARSSSWPRAPTCSPRPPTCCASSATSPAASASRAASGRPRRTRSSPITSRPAAAPDGLDERITELEQVMRRTSICGLGQVALGPVASVLRLASSGGSRDEG